MSHITDVQSAELLMSKICNISVGIITSLVKMSIKMSRETKLPLSV